MHPQVDLPLARIRVDVDPAAVESDYPTVLQLRVGWHPDPSERCQLELDRVRIVNRVLAAGTGRALVTAATTHCRDQQRRPGRQRLQAPQILCPHVLSPCFCAAGRRGEWFVVYCAAAIVVAVLSPSASKLPVTVTQRSSSAVSAMRKPRARISNEPDSCPSTARVIVTVPDSPWNQPSG